MKGNVTKQSKNLHLSPRSKALYSLLTYKPAREIDLKLFHAKAINNLSSVQANLSKADTSYASGGCR